MKKYREFDNVLNECLERLLSRGENLEQCLQGFPEYADELRPLLETALAAKEASAIQPRSEFREKARYQFYSALREVERKRSRSFLSWSRQPRWAMVVAIVLILFLAGGGTAAAAADSMPDEPLYPVKLATEQVQLAFTFSRLGKAEVYARLTDRRVSEIVSMADKGKPAQVEQAARRLEAYLAKITDLASAGKVAMIAMAPVAPAPSVAGEAAAGGKEATHGEKGGEQEPIVGEAPSVTEREPIREAPSVKKGEKEAGKVDRRARLKEIVVRKAVENPGRLRAVLEKAPESARPALLEAIRLSEAGYEKALESMDEP